MKNFWKEIERPFFCLAPMDDVTDCAFRKVIAEKSKAVNSDTYVTFTEFTSADGLVCADQQGQTRLRAKFRFSEIERPIVAQIFGSKLENIEKAAGIARELGFDGVDINMGCPDAGVMRQGGGAALIKNPELARKIIESAIKGADGIPVSIKTRIGDTKNILKDWLPVLLDTGVSAITVHARTRKEMSKVPANWDTVNDAVLLRDKLNKSVLIIGNGDAKNLKDAKEKKEKYGCDGVMLGRAVFGNPWVMSDYYPTLEEKISALITHVRYFEKEFRGIKQFALMKKHFSSYILGFDGAKELRIMLMDTENAEEAIKILKTYENK